MKIQTLLTMAPHNLLRSLTVTITIILQKLTYCFMVEANRRERAEALKRVKELCKEFIFTAGMLKSDSAEDRKKK